MLPVQQNKKAYCVSILVLLCCFTTNVNAFDAETWAQFAAAHGAKGTLPLSDDNKDMKTVHLGWTTNVVMTALYMKDKTLRVM